MNTSDQYEKFFDILKTENVLFKFLENPALRNTNSVSLNPIDLFLSWARTEEGGDYWNKLNKKCRFTSPIHFNTFKNYAYDRINAEYTYEYW